jgi:hypothetical protein
MVQYMSQDNFEEAFKTWWNPDPDEESDLPYPDISKKKQKAIFLAGYLWGSRKPIYQMSATNYMVIVRAIEEKIRKEKK